MNIDSVSQAARPIEAASPAQTARATATAEDKSGAARPDETQVDLSRTAKLIAKNDAAASASATTSGTTAAADSTASIRPIPSRSGSPTPTVTRSPRWSG